MCGGQDLANNSCCSSILVAIPDTPNLVTKNTIIKLLGVLYLLNKGKTTIFTFIGVQYVHQRLKTAQLNLISAINRNTSSSKTTF